MTFTNVNFSKFNTTTKKIEKIPIILVGCDFWNPLNEIVRKELLSRGTIDPDDMELYHILDDEEEIINVIKNAPVRNGIKFNHNSSNMDKSF